MKRILILVFFLVSVWVFSCAGNYSDANGLKSNPGLSEETVTSIHAGTQKTAEFNLRIATSLQKLSKNLILENTRGTKEITAYQKAAPAVVFVLTESGFGSGSVIDTKGQVITNWHVVKNYQDVVVVFKAKDSAELKKELAFSAKVKKVDQRSDLALLQIKNPPKSVPFMKLGDSSNISVGQDVHAIGHPQGEVWTYTKGIVSQIRPDYEWKTEEGVKHRAKIIQTQTPISPGSSGGPLFADNGNLIGINSFLHPSGSLHYAVAVDEIKKFLRKKESSKNDYNKSDSEPNCIESYDTTGAGWPNIQGCLFFSNDLPLDFWIVFSKPQKPAEYVAADPSGIGQINTVIVSKENKWQELYYLMDNDCDGIIDLIGKQIAGENDIGDYRVPSEKISLHSLAKELGSAINNKKIPYWKLRFCK